MPNAEAKKPCLFCKIAKGEAPSFKIMEDDEHLAILDIFPLVKGQAVVITKVHHSGYQFDMPDDAYSKLMMFSKKVGKAIDRGMGSERCMLVVQGYAIDHVHTKLFPVTRVNSTVVNQESYSALKSMLEKEWYGGFIVSMSGKERAQDKDLEELAKRIRVTD